jgi:hypothetical protein
LGVPGRNDRVFLGPRGVAVGTDGGKDRVERVVDVRVAAIERVGRGLDFRDREDRGLGEMIRRTLVHGGLLPVSPAHVADTVPQRRDALNRNRSRRSCTAGRFFHDTIMVADSGSGFVPAM